MPWEGGGVIFADLFCCFHVSEEAAVTRYTAHGGAEEGWSSEGPKTIFYPVRIVSVPTGIQLVKNLKLVKEMIKVGSGEK